MTNQTDQTLTNLLREYQKTVPADGGLQSYNWVPKYTAPAGLGWGCTCPRCGYCPHCGRGGDHFYPQYPASPFYSQGFVSQSAAVDDGGPVIGDADCGTAENV